MSQLFSQLSNEIAAGGRSRVGVRRSECTAIAGRSPASSSPTISSPPRPARSATIRRYRAAAGGGTHEGAVLGHALSMGLGVVRVPASASRRSQSATSRKVGHLAIAIGRTWSGGVMATVTNVAVVGGPLRTGRASQIERVIRIAQSPHGALSGGALVDGEGRALGLITGSEIRGTTIVLPATLAWARGTGTRRSGRHADRGSSGSARRRVRAAGSAARRPRAGISALLVNGHRRRQPG